MEIERKFLIKKDRFPDNLAQYPCHEIEQGYLCTEPVAVSYTHLDVYKRQG